jgi:hypothetical protein
VSVVAYDVTLERRIRELCAQAIAAQDTDQFQPILSELRKALRAHTEQLKSLVEEYPFLPVDVDKVVPLAKSARAQERSPAKKKAI